MSLKLHFMDPYVEYFPENLGDYSKEQGETISRKMGWKYDGWLLLDVEKRCTSERKYTKRILEGNSL